MDRIPRNWLDDYLIRSGDTWESVEEALDELIVNEMGFVNYSVVGDTMDWTVVYGPGNGLYWRTFMMNLAKGLGLKKIRGYSTRYPTNYIDNWHYQVVGYIVEKEVK